MMKKILLTTLFALGMFTIIYPQDASTWCVEFSANGKLLAVGFSNGLVELYQNEGLYNLNYRLKDEIKITNSPIRELCFYKDHLFIIERNRNIYVYNLNTHKYATITVDFNLYLSVYDELLQVLYDLGYKEDLISFMIADLFKGKIPEPIIELNNEKLTLYVEYIIETVQSQELLQFYSDMNNYCVTSENLLAISSSISSRIVFFDMDRLLTLENGTILNTNTYNHFTSRLTSLKMVSFYTINKLNPAYLGEINCSECQGRFDLFSIKGKTKLFSINGDKTLVTWNIKNLKQDNAIDTYEYLRQLPFDASSYTKKINGIDYTETEHVITISDWSKYGQVQVWDLNEGVLKSNLETVQPGNGNGVTCIDYKNYVITWGDLYYTVLTIQGNALVSLNRIDSEDDIMLSRQVVKPVDYCKVNNFMAVCFSKNVFVISVSDFNKFQSLRNPEKKLSVWGPRN